jgi:hypothetical protein
VSTQDGLSPSFISLDESHAQTFELRDVLVSAMGARPDGAIWCPTTADYDLTSIGYALRSTATRILDGVIESDHSSVVLYELDEADAWDDAATWIKAAPMIGITPALDYVKRYCTDAQQTPGMEAEFQTMQPLAALGERMAVDGYQQEQVSNWRGRSRTSPCRRNRKAPPWSTRAWSRFKGARGSSRRWRGCSTRSSPRVGRSKWLSAQYSTQTSEIWTCARQRTKEP